MKLAMTKVTILAVFACLGAVAGCGDSGAATSAPKPGTPKWEYISISADVSFTMKKQSDVTGDNITYGAHPSLEITLSTATGKHEFKTVLELYKHFKLDGTEESGFLPLLNQLGAEGWDLVCIESYPYATPVVSNAASTANYFPSPVRRVWTLKRPI